MKPPLSELARPGKRAVVASDLDQLHGPTRGVVELPHRLFWQADRHFDLDQPFMLQWLYEIVLLEARSIADLCAWLHGSTLHRLWARLYLPRGVRHAWERRYPSLYRARQESPDQAQPHHGPPAVGVT